MNRKHVAAWTLFDFANSVYPAVIQAAVFSAWYTGYVVGNEAGRGTSWWGWALSTSALVVAVSSPVLGAIADRCGVRKRFMLGYTATCILGVSMFTVLDQGMVLLGFLLFVVANVGFEGALVFYNAYLPDIAPKEKQGRVSGWGFGVGYAGSILGLVAVLPLVPEGGTMPAVWLMVAAFFALFSIPAFIFLPADERTGVPIGEAARWGIQNVRQLVGEVLAIRELRRFLLAYFFFIDFVVTVIGMSGPFAENEFGFGRRELVLLFLVVQFSALAGAFVFAKPTDKYGPKRVLTFTLSLWAVLAFGVYFVQTQEMFFALAVMAGLGLGSTQAASRAFMSSLIPDGKEAEMFGFYALCGKSSSIMGPWLFGTIALMTGGSERLAVLGLLVILVTGALLLQRVRDPKAPGAVEGTA